LELDEAKKSGDAINIKKAQDALTRVKIEEDFAKEEDAINKKAATEQYKLQLAAFKTGQAFSIIQTIIDTTEMAVKSFKWASGWGGPIAGAIAAGVASGFGIAKIAMIKKQVPPAAPSFAEGGIAMPKNGGMLANVADGGVPEVIFPLDKLETFLSNRSFSGSTSSDNVPINMTIKLDSKVLYSGIHSATKNHTILIDATAVV
jgi:hypothetical protein